MLDGRVLGASQVEFKPFGKPPLKRELQPAEPAPHRGRNSDFALHRGRNSDFAFLPETHHRAAPKVCQRRRPRSIADRVFFFTIHTPSRQSWRGHRIVDLHELRAAGGLERAARRLQGLKHEVAHLKEHAPLPGLVSMSQGNFSASEKKTACLHGRKKKKR